MASLLFAAGARRFAANFAQFTASRQPNKTSRVCLDAVTGRRLLFSTREEKVLAPGVCCCQCSFAEREIPNEWRDASAQPWK
jgi:hypothetical protein